MVSSTVGSSTSLWNTCSYASFFNVIGDIRLRWSQPIIMQTISPAGLVLFICTICQWLICISTIVWIFRQWTESHCLQIWQCHLIQLLSALQSHLGILLLLIKPLNPARVSAKFSRLPVLRRWQYVGLSLPPTRFYPRPAHRLTPDYFWYGVVRFAPYGEFLHRAQ